MGHKHSRERQRRGGQEAGAAYQPGAEPAAAEDESKPYEFKAFANKYESLEMVQDGLRRSGLESSNLILGIDYTISNVSAGTQTFGGRNLHEIVPGQMNPYQQVISTVGRTLEVFDDDKIIPAYGFGDKATTDKTVFSLAEPDSKGFEQVLQHYNEVTPRVALGGPTSYAPVVRKAIEIVREARAYHILVIVADGQVTPDTEFCQASSETTAAIVEASNYPISIIVVGVGDGPWDQMREYDEQLPQRRFDNFHFVEFHKVWNLEGGDVNRKDASFAVSALQEIPEQYMAIRKLHLI
eukprot:m51a1_g11724 hypothetical protein (296) ;mRNA; f:104990-106192